MVDHLHFQYLGDNVKEFLRFILLFSKCIYERFLNHFQVYGCIICGLGHAKKCLGKI